MARGYDNIWLNSQLLLDLQFREGSGSLYYDFAKPHHVVTGEGGIPYWVGLASDLYCLGFNAAGSDYAQATNAVSLDLDFTTEDFSLAVWIDPNLEGNRYLFNRGLTLQDGWRFFYDTNEALVLGTTTGVTDYFTQSVEGAVVVGEWALVGCTRSGTAVRVYKNGRDVTAVYAAHGDPDTSVRNLYIGRSDGGAGSYDGDMWRPRIWERALPPAEWKSIFEMERGYFGV